MNTVQTLELGDDKIKDFVFFYFAGDFEANEINLNKVVIQIQNHRNSGVICLIGVFDKSLAERNSASDSFLKLMKSFDLAGFAERENEFKAIVESCYYCDKGDVVVNPIDYLSLRTESNNQFEFITKTADNLAQAAELVGKELDGKIKMHKAIISIAAPEDLQISEIKDCVERIKKNSPDFMTYLSIRKCEKGTTVSVMFT